MAKSGLTGHCPISMNRLQRFVLYQGDFSKLIFWRFVDIVMMTYALRLAKLGAKKGEIPVGAVICFDDKMIAEGYNCPIGTNDPTAHAEIIALRQACTGLHNYRLPKNSTLYVTLEPCTMCIGALIHARVGRIIYGASEPKSGAITTLNLLQSSYYNHKIRVTGGLLADECGVVLSQFFKDRRADKKLKNKGF